MTTEPMNTTDSAGQETPDPLSYKQFMKSVEEGRQTFDKTKAGLTFLARMVFALLFFLAGVLSFTTAPLLRRRIGLLVVITQAPFALLIVGIYVDVVRSKGVDPALFGWWAAALFLLSMMHFALGMGRLYGQLRRHVHRWSPGEPHPGMVRLWSRVLWFMASDDRRLATYGEVVLLLALTLLFTFVGEPVIGRVTGMLAFATFAAALGTAAQSFVVITRQAWQRQVMLDQQLEQTAMAESLSGHAQSADAREVEGVMEIPR